MKNFGGRIGKIESKVVANADTSPHLVTLHSIDDQPVRFTRESFMRYARDTMPGFAHPTRGLFATLWLDFLGRWSDDHPDEPKPYSKEHLDAMNERLGALLAGLDQLIVDGKVEWLDQAVNAWKAKNPAPKNGDYVLP